MIVLGIDPGSVTMGYGLVDSNDGEAAYLDCGVINTPSRSTVGERLSYLYKTLTDIIRKTSPDAVAVEQPFVARNVKSAFTIGRAQAVAILAAANQDIPIFEYAPRDIKQRVTSYGASSKEQVQEMVRLQLGLREPPKPLDASDALAVALCHLGEMHVQNLLSER